jgi:predicted nucleic acid-binding protein
VPDGRVLIDTGPLVALVSSRDAHHRPCLETLAQLDPPLLTCWPVLTELAWLLRDRPDVLAKVFEGFATGLFALLALDASALPCIAQFLRRYASIGAQLADAALVHLAE